jgi:hypothetical protein
MVRASLPQTKIVLMKRCSWFVLFLAFTAALAGCAGYMPPDDFTVQSVRLSHFWHHPVSVRAQVLLPSSYAASAQRHYPVIYWIHAFGGSYHIGRTAEHNWRTAMAKAHSEYILVFLDAELRRVHHEFADSANNGPWGTALVSEFIPALDKRFRTIPSKRFLAGHSSGAWAALWLQLNYPKVFAGAWAISPDPVDFHDFAGLDLARPQQNFYRDSYGRDYGFVRRNGHDTTTLRQFVQNVPWAGAQFDSFDAVFSPRYPEGKPKRLFDRRTGRIDASVARYWEAHYDIDALIQKHWTEMRPWIDGKLHVFVGTQDTYHLDGPVRRMAAAFSALHGHGEFDFVSGAGHNDIFQKGDVIDRCVAEMSQIKSPST